MSARGYRGNTGAIWKVHAVALIGIVLVSLNLRTAVTSISPLLTEIDAELGLGASGMGLLGMVPTAMFALWGICTPWVIRRLGLEWTTALAMSLAAIGQILRAVADTSGLVGVGSLIALTGMGIGNVVAPPLVKKYFPQQVPTVSTIYITGLQIGTVVPALMAVPVADAAGWRVSIGWWAGLAVLAVIPWIVELCRGTDSDPAAAEVPGAPGPSQERVRPWRSPVGLAMGLFFGTNSLGTYAFFTWLPAVAESIGLSRAEGGIALAVFSAIGLIGALVVPRIAGRFDDPYGVVIFSVACYLIAFAGLLLAPGWMPWLWIVMLGFGPSTFPLCLTLINLRTRTGAGSASLSGFAQGVGYGAASLGPIVFGMLFTGPGLGAGLGFLTVVLAVMCFVARIACRPRMLEDTPFRSVKAKPVVSM